MALVVFLRGINVGGRRRFRPSRLAAELAHLGVVSIGATGTFVIRRPVSQSEVRREIARRLPFEADIMICNGGELSPLLARDFLAGESLAPGTVRFVSVLPRAPRTVPRLPLRLPATGPWLVKVIARDKRFVIGVYRRHMRVISHL